MRSRARRSLGAGTGRWVAQPVDRPDTLVRDGTGYARILPRGLVVKFNVQGQHVATVTRLGHTTTFSYSAGRLTRIELPIPATTQTTRYCTDPATCLPPGSPPTPSIAAPVYLFSYETDRVRITAPPSPLPPGVTGPPLARETLITLSTGVVQSIRDPDEVLTSFEYDPVAVRRIRARIDRRGTRTRFGYTATGHFLNYASVDSVPGTPWIETRFPQVAEAQGLAVAGTTARAVAVADVHTLIDGPRPDADVLDHTRVWTDRFGAPAKIRNALGQETVLARGDGRFPALVTGTLAPNNLLTQATYDARGNLATSTVVRPYGDARDATTSYVWHQVFDAVERVTLPEEEVTTFGYDPRTGNRLWQEDGRGVTSRVTFDYSQTWVAPGAPGLLRASELPGGFRDSVAYDALGNVAAVRRPDTTWTHFVNDHAGRTTVVRQQINRAATPAWQEDSTTYDLLDRATRTVAYGPAYGGQPEQRVIVQNFYNVAGQLDSLQRLILPTTPTNLGVLTTHWRYDPAGRVTAELAPDNTPETLADNPVDATFYDRAGNAIRVKPRRRSEMADDIVMEYDALNRLTRRSLPAVTYAERNEGIPATQAPFQSTVLGENPPYPRYDKNAQGQYVIPADVATFEYDALGNQTVADNSSARVHRSYYPNGLLRRDSLYVRAVGSCPAGGDPFACHAYGLELAYDRNGRRTELKHPTQLAPVVGGAAKDRTRYTYHPQTGALETVTDVLENQFRYQFNLRNELEALTLPVGSAREAYGYDRAGNLTLHRAWSITGVLLRQTALTYDARGKALTTKNGHFALDTLTVAYSGLGHVVTSNLTAHAGDVRHLTSESFALDALGNLSEQSTYTERRLNGHVPDASTASPTNHYEAGTGRLAKAVELSQSDTTHYDAAGNVVFTKQVQALESAFLRNRASYYAADGTLRAADYRTVANWTLTSGSKFKAVFEEYRYDALGRRVLVRARRTCTNPVFAMYTDSREYGECTLSLVRRTVWDGSQELWEIQMPAGNQTPADTVENDTAPVQRARVEGLDPNPFFGRVVYAHGLLIDQPLSQVRVAYADAPVGKPWRSWQPFTIVPFWNTRQQPDNFYFPVGGGTHCPWADDTGRCVLLSVPAAWSVFGSYAPVGIPAYWHGTLTQDKRDKAGTLYRRNRQYDPQTGRFTQEDPIGLAGGTNLYGFANADPINLSDPFGLCPEEQRDKDGRCPGGLSVEEWQSIETAAAELESEAEKEVLAKLKRGEFHSGAWWLPEEVSGFASPTSNHVYLNAQSVGGSVFRWTSTELAFLVAHEMGHLRQYARWGMVYSLILGAADVLLHGGPTEGLDLGADAYACQVVRNAMQRFQVCGR